MKWFKIVDVIVQVAITFVALLMWNRYTFFIFYYGIGGWQVFSCLIHLVAYKDIERSPSRRRYERVLAWVLGIGAIGGGLVLINQEIGVMLLLLLGVVMLVGGPLMAIWYFIDCMSEIKYLFDKVEQPEIPERNGVV